MTKSKSVPDIKKLEGETYTEALCRTLAKVTLENETLRSDNNVLRKKEKSRLMVEEARKYFEKVDNG